MTVFGWNVKVVIGRLAPKEIWIKFTKKFEWTGYRKMARHFSDQEIKGLSEKLVGMLDSAREFAGVPIILTSGFRDPEKNTSVGGVSDSSHVKGLAADIRAPNDEYGKRVAFGLGRAGFERAGIYDRHIHVDIDSEKQTPAVWQGKSH